MLQMLCKQQILFGYSKISFILGGMGDEIYILFIKTYLISVYYSSFYEDFFADIYSIIYAFYSRLQLTAPVYAQFYKGNIW